jgi:chromosome segregation ATPase
LRRTLLQSPAFFQVSAVKTKAAKRMALRNKAVSQLSAAAKTSKSAVLAGLLEEVEKDPFAKVKVLIRQLIERLLSEAKAESTQKGFCDTEMGKAKKDRDFKHEETTKLAAGIMELEAHITKLKETIETLGTELTDLSADLVDATEQRDTEKANNNKTMADGKEGLAALKEAIQVLTDYYKGGLKSKNRYEGGGYEGAALVQESPVTADMGAAGVEGGEKGAYAGNQEAGAGIISMLEVIKSDFERTLETTESNEYQQSRDFADFSRTTKASIATKETGLKQAKEDLERTSGGLIAALNDLQTSQELLDKALEALAALYPTCVDTGMTYEERVAKREAEINALKDALCVLDEEDKEIPECSSFLQSK